MKILTYKNTLLFILFSIGGVNILSAQKLIFPESPAPVVYDLSTTLTKEKTNYPEENNSSTKETQEVGTILFSFVDTRSDGFSGFLGGSCTEYIARQRPELFVNKDGSRRMTGNAEDRLRNAQRLGYDVGKSPKQGAIAVYYEGKGGRKYGHVAYVEQVQNNGTIIVSEMNYNQEYVVTWRVVKSDLAAGYIY